MPTATPLVLEPERAYRTAKLRQWDDPARPARRQRAREELVSRGHGLWLAPRTTRAGTRREQEAVCPVLRSAA